MTTGHIWRILSISDEVLMILRGYELADDCLGRSEKIGRIGPADTQFSHAGAQGADVEPMDFWGPVFPADFPAGFLKYPYNMDTIYIISAFQSSNF